MVKSQTTLFYGDKSSLDWPYSKKYSNNPRNFKKSKIPILTQSPLDMHNCLPEIHNFNS